MQRRLSLRAGSSFPSVLCGFTLQIKLSLILKVVAGFRENIKKSPPVNESHNQLYERNNLLIGVSRES